MDKSINSVILGSLFHDIGKFIQKCEFDFRDQLFGDGREDLCPKNKYGRDTHIHVKYTDAFFNYFYENFKNVWDFFNLKESYEACWHHLPSDNSPIQWLIAKADWYSSGIDRSDDELNEEISGKNYYKIPLYSILSEVKIFNKIENISSITFPLKKFTPKNIAINKDINSTKHTREDYTNFFKKFLADFELLNEKFFKLNKDELTFYNYCKAVDNLLLRYLWCIPSTVKDYPDISLYDHSITTAAIAVCLYKFHTENNSINNTELIKDDNIEKFLFISGDVSGIQNYIFDIKKGKYSAKSLRARSFKVQVISENISNLILDELNLPKFNKILNAGGRFLLLLPNTISVIENLREIKEKVEKIFLKEFLGELTLNISEPVKVKGEDFSINKMPFLYSKIQKSIEIAKLKKLQIVLKTPDNFVISNYYDKFSSHQDLCPICEKMPIVENKELCKQCNEIVEIGSKLPKAKYIIWTNEIVDFPEILKEKNSNNFYCSLNSYDIPFETYYSPYYVPIENDEILTFEELSKKNQGANYLAMFKADIDNLGLIFTVGLGKNRSISRTATLSRLINAYFTGYLNTFISEFFSNIYVVFSGGDDVCVIGPWEEIIIFAKEFHKKFEEFTGANRHITISAGISLFHHNLPIKNVAQEAEFLLEKSKSGNKNSITVFNTTVTWNEFKMAINEGIRLDNWIKRKIITKGMLYRLLQYSRMKNSTQAGFVKNAMWRAYLYYDTARNFKKNNELTKDDYLNFIENLINQKYSEISINYAIYKNREVKNV